MPRLLINQLLGFKRSFFKTTNDQNIYFILALSRSNKLPLKWFEVNDQSQNNCF